MNRFCHGLLGGQREQGGCSARTHNGSSSAGCSDLLRPVPPDQAKSVRGAVFAEHEIVQVRGPSILHRVLVLIGEGQIRRGARTIVILAVRSVGHIVILCARCSRGHARMSAATEMAERVEFEYSRYLQVPVE